MQWRVTGEAITEASHWRRHQWNEPTAPRSDNTPATGQSEGFEWPICPVCKHWQMLPRKGLPRSLFCIAARRGRLSPLAMRQQRRAKTRTAPTRTIVEGGTMVWPERDSQVWPTPGALQGDDYPLEYYEDGYPKLPACLDQRPVKLAEAA